jgi:translation initiation factor IF-3
MIRIPQVRVVDEEGAQLGIMPTARALEMAQERGLDLVEVAPMAQPPVTRFLDFGQYKYELTKREKENKRRQRSVTFKEVRLSPKIGSGDFETKVHRAIEFLEEGDRIKVTVRFRGRELTHPEIGRNLIARFVERVGEHGVQERTPLLEGKSMHITMASTHKPKVHEAPRADRPAGRPAVEGSNGQEAPAAGPEAEEPKAEQPEAAQPEAVAPKAAQPKVETPQAEAPKAEQPKAAQPKVEEKSEAPAAQPASTAATPAAATGE